MVQFINIHKRTALLWICLWSLMWGFNSCDDGKIEARSLDFSQVGIQSCGTNNLLYKNNGTEMLILNIPLSNFINDVSTDSNPVTVALNSSQYVLYRAYNGNVSANNICPTLPATSPQVQQEWVANSGTVVISTTAIKSYNSSTQATRITGYKHHIVLRNLTWSTPSGPVVWAYDYTYGDYQTSVNAPAVAFGQTLYSSSCDGRVFACSGGESMELNLANPTEVFAPETTPVGQPRVLVLDANNKMTYRSYAGVISPAYYCTLPLPTTPALQEAWVANAGVSGQSGWIEVETTTYGNGFQHTITCCKVTLTKGNSDFYLGERYVLGTLLTQ